MASMTKGATTTLYYYDVNNGRQVKFEQTTHSYKVYPNKFYEEKRSGDKNKYVFLGDLRLLTVTGTSTPVANLNFTDHLNSSSITTDSNGNITNLNDYLPYGTDRVNIKNSAFNPSYKFTDQELDDDSGLYYYGARYYNQYIGRFIQVDPINIISPERYILDPQQLNYYSYARNNPIRYIDPTGNVSIETNENDKTFMTIESGDTLSAISQIFGMDYQSLADQLGITDPNKIHAGDRYDVTPLIALGTAGYFNLKNGITIRVDDPGNNAKNQYHSHVYDRYGNQIASENLDGSKHDKGPNIPEKIKQQLINDKKFQKFEELNKEWQDTHKGDKNNSDTTGGDYNNNSGNGNSTQDNAFLMMLNMINPGFRPIPLKIPEFKLNFFRPVFGL